MKILRLIGLVVLCIVLLYIMYAMQPTGRVYDCGMAEWHPDIPVEVKEECRKRNQEDYRRQRPIKSSIITT